MVSVIRYPFVANKLKLQIVTLFLGNAPMMNYGAGCISNWLTYANLCKDTEADF
jgi:hypothetical protein